MARPNASAPVKRQPIRSVKDAAVGGRRLETSVLGLATFPPLANGWSLVPIYAVGYGTEIVNHGLGRVPVGLLVVATQAPRPNPGMVSADATRMTLDFGGVEGDMTLLVW